MRIHWEHPKAKVSDGGMTAEVTSGLVRIAYAGCMLPATSIPTKKDHPKEHDLAGSLLDRLYGSRKAWKRREKSTALLSRSLVRLIQVAGAAGIHLVDTMRSGSDYWRPGKLLSDAVQEMRNSLNNAHSAQATYGRFDELCPSLQLLARFRAGDSMTFGMYATAYASELGQSDALEVALADCIIQNARGWIPVFYCTDPYIKGYAPSKEALSPYQTRGWFPQFRQVGCHRVVLVEELVRSILAKGFTVELFELDQLSDVGFHRRVFSKTND